MLKKISDFASRLTTRNWILLALVFGWLCMDFSYKLRGLYRVFILLPCGLGALIYMFAKRKVVIDRFTVLVAATCGFLVLASVLKRINAMDSLATLATYLVFMLFAAITPKNAEPRALQKEFTSISAIWIIFLVPFMLLGLVSVFTGRPIQLPVADATIGIHQTGFLNDRISILGNPNADARCALTALFFAIYLMHKKLSKLVRGLLLATVFISALVITHTQSRTTIYALCAGLGAIAFRFCYLRIHSRGKRFTAGITAWIAVFAASIFILLALFTLDIQIAIKSASVSGVDASEISRFITANPIDIVESGRGRVWKAGARYLLDHPRYIIFGMGSGEIMSTFSKAANDPWVCSITHLHNAFFELLARGGIFSVACMLGALVLLVRPCLRLFVAPEVNGDRGAYILAVLIGMFLIISLVEVSIFAATGPFNLLFFFAAGHIMRLNREGKLSRGVDDPARK